MRGSVPHKRGRTIPGRSGQVRLDSIGSPLLAMEYLRPRSQLLYARHTNSIPICQSCRGLWSNCPWVELGTVWDWFSIFGG